jgi:hypothetical protein
MEEMLAKMEDTRVGSLIKELDAFPKVDTAYLQKTSSGGLFTILTVGLLGTLMCAELFRYLMPALQQYYIVDPTIGYRVPLELDISIATECEKLVVLQGDVAGGTRILNDELEAYAEDFANVRTTAGDWAKQVMKHKSLEEEQIYGCRIRGRIDVSNSGGKLMILPITVAMGQLGAFLSRLDDSVNFSHYVHHLSFGTTYPGMSNPMNGVNQLTMRPHEHFTYFLSIISTSYKAAGRNIQTNQYALNGFKSQLGADEVDDPGLFFNYSHEPLALIITHESIDFISFLIHLVGIIGGVYTCTGLIHQIIHTAWTRLIKLVGWGQRKDAKRFDAGWSPVMGQDRPRIVKTIALSECGEDKAFLA